MVKKANKQSHKKADRFEPGRVLIMVVVVSVLTIALFGAISIL